MMERHAARAYFVGGVALVMIKRSSIPYRTAWWSGLRKKVWGSG